MEARGKHDGNPTDQSVQVGALISDLMRDEYAVRSRAVRHLVSLGHAASPALVKALGAESVELRWQAALALRGIADAATAPALLDALEDDDIGVRWLAAEALAAIGVPALAPLLEGLIHRADSIFFREGATHVLLSLTEGRLGPIVRPVLLALQHLGAEISAPVAAYEALEALERRGIDTHASPPLSS